MDGDWTRGWAGITAYEKASGMKDDKRHQDQHCSTWQCEKIVFCYHSDGKSSTDLFALDTKDIADPA